MEVNEILGSLGDPGLFQIIMYIALIVCNSTTAMNHLLMAVLGFSPNHNCKYPNSFSKNLAIPKTSTGVFEKCVMYKTSNNNDTTFLNSTTTCGGKWEFDLMPGESSIVTEWSLVCDRKYLVGTATTIYFAGVMIGGAVFGQLGDKFGRKIILLICMYTHIVLGVIIYFMTYFEAFVALRFFVGFVIQGIQTCSYVLLVEMTVPKHRPITAGIFEVAWAVGNLWMSLLAWLIPDWRVFQLAICLPSLITLSYIYLLPESIRWLTLNGKIPQAKAVAQKIAAFNKITLPDQFEIYAARGTTKGDGQLYSFHDLVRTPEIRKRTMLMCYIWLACSIGYYGLSLSVGQLAGNRHFNLFLSAFVEFVAFTLTVFVLKYFSRRYPLIFYFIFGGITCITAGSIKSSSYEDKDIIAKVFAISGKFFISAGFATIFLFTVELFPTVVRTIGMGSCVLWARVGGMIAPQILLLGNYTFDELPYLIFGCLSLLAGIAAYFLPETRGIKLPDTIDAIELIQERVQEKGLYPGQDSSNTTKL